jgi:pentapeptide MXKDX repeat protein
MSKPLFTALAFFAATATAAAFAPNSLDVRSPVTAVQMKKDDMKKDSMAKDDMKKDSMKKDDMKKDTMTKDDMKKDTMKK